MITDKCYFPTFRYCISASSEDFSFSLQSAKYTEMRTNENTLEIEWNQEMIM